MARVPRSYILADSEDDAMDVIDAVKPKLPCDTYTREDCLEEECEHHEEVCNIRYCEENDEIEYITSVSSVEDVYNFVNTYSIYDDIYLRDCAELKFFRSYKRMIDLTGYAENKIKEFKSAILGEYDFG